MGYAITQNRSATDGATPTPSPYSSQSSTAAAPNGAIVAVSALATQQSHTLFINVKPWGKPRQRPRLVSVSGDLTQLLEEVSVALNVEVVELWNEKQATISSVKALSADAVYFGATQQDVAAADDDSDAAA